MGSCWRAVGSSLEVFVIMFFWWCLLGSNTLVVGGLPVVYGLIQTLLSHLSSLASSSCFLLACISLWYCSCCCPCCCFRLMLVSMDGRVTKSPGGKCCAYMWGGCHSPRPRCGIVLAVVFAWWHVLASMDGRVINFHVLVDNAARICGMDVILLDSDGTALYDLLDSIPVVPPLIGSLTSGIVWMDGGLASWQQGRV